MPRLLSAQPDGTEGIMLTITNFSKTYAGGKKAVDNLSLTVNAGEIDPLDEDALVRVLKEPKNSLVKQYQTLMKLDSVELDITDEALHAIAKKTIALKSGARGLRSVMEQSLIGIMYEIPSDPTIIKVTVDEETVNGAKPKLEYGAVRKRYKALASGRVN